MNYHQAKRLMTDYWKDRKTHGCKWRITKGDVTKPGYVFVWKGMTLMRSLYSDGFGKDHITDMLHTISRLTR